LPYNGFMTISPDLLKDFIDGKLSSEEASSIAAKLASDPELAAYVEDQKAVRAALTAPPIVRLRQWNEKIASSSAAWIPAAAVAAGIVLGVLLAASFGIGTDLRGASGSLVAQNELAQALSARLSNEETQGNTLVGASFWSKNGAFCRSFAIRGNAESAMTGIACRERGAWRIAVMATVAPNEISFPLVSAALPASVRGVMENLIVGQTLDADAERQARSQGWRVR
jgi:hypothetical protein